MIARLREATRKDDGASAVEFALVLPLLALLVFGIITFGFYFAGALGLSNGTREAARYGVVQNRTCADLASEIRSTVKGTLGVIYPITFTATRGSSVCKGSIAAPSSSGSDGAITYSTSATTVLCAGSKPGADELTVTTSAGAGDFIPFVSFDLSLTGKGAYRCEFS